MPLTEIVRRQERDQVDLRAEREPKQAAPVSGHGPPRPPPARKADEGCEEERDCHICGEDAVKQESDQRSTRQRSEAHDIKDRRRNRWRHAAVHEAQVLLGTHLNSKRQKTFRLKWPIFCTLWQKYLEYCPKLSA
jgi:hypothetical protein